VKGEVTPFKFHFIPLFMGIHTPALKFSGSKGARWKISCPWR